MASPVRTVWENASTPSATAGSSSFSRAAASSWRSGEQGVAAVVQVLALAVQLGKGDDLGEVGVQQPLLLALQLRS